MRLLTSGRGVRVQTLFLMSIVIGGVLFQSGARGQGPGPGGITQVLVLDNEVFNVRRLTFAPGYRQTMHGTGAKLDEIVVLLTPGQIEVQIDENKTSGPENVGKVWWVPKPPSQHAFGNLGKQPIDLLVVQAK